MKTNSVIGDHHIIGLDQFRELAITLGEQLRAGDIVLLIGDLGSGKTTFTQFLGQALGVSDRITSPTYTLVGEYAVENNPDIRTLIHMDLYRIGESNKQIPLNNKYIQEVLDTAIHMKAVVVIEWPEKFGIASNLHCWKIAIGPGDTPQGRSVTVGRVQ